MTQPAGERDHAYQRAAFAPIRSAPPQVAVLSVIADADLAAALGDDRWGLIPCADTPALLEAVVKCRPSVVVVGLGDHSDFGLLHVVRRAAPEVPLILVAGRSDLDLQRSLQVMRPYYFDVVPFDPEALRDAVGSAIRPGRRRPPGR